MDIHNMGNLPGGVLNSGIGSKSPSNGGGQCVRGHW